VLQKIFKPSLLFQSKLKPLLSFLIAKKKQKTTKGALPLFENPAICKTAEILERISRTLQIDIWCNKNS